MDGVHAQRLGAGVRATDQPRVPSRKNIAIVALARKLLVTLWAMLRDGTRWRAPIGEPAGIATAA